MATWNLIDTAPKDGTEFIGKCDYELHICSWEALDNPVAQFLGIEGTWHRRCITSGKGLMGGNFRPTHWIPMPKYKE